MFIDEIKRAVEKAARVELSAVSVALWQAYRAGHVTDADAESLEALIEARRALPVIAKAAPKAVGSRPLTDESLVRRRRWAAAGRLPPALAAQFTLAEQAVLAVIACEVAERGDCRMPVGRIAALAGVGESSLHRAFRAARERGLITIEERRLSAFRNDTNIVRIVSAEWQAWMRLPRGGEGGCQSRQGSNTAYLKKVAKRLEQASKRLSKQRERDRKTRPRSRKGSGKRQHGPESSPERVVG